jgi:hypothetical protein
MLLPEGVINLCADTCRHHLRDSYNPTRPACGSNWRENSAHGAANHVTSSGTTTAQSGIAVPNGYFFRGERVNGARTPLSFGVLSISSLPHQTAKN